MYVLCLTSNQANIEQSKKSHWLPPRTVGQWVTSQDRKRIISTVRFNCSAVAVDRSLKYKDVTNVHIYAENSLSRMEMEMFAWFAEMHYLPKRNQSSLLFLHSITVARIACTTSSSTCVLAFRQHSSTAKHPYTSVTHRNTKLSFVLFIYKNGFIIMYVCVCVCTLTVILLPVDYSSSSQSDESVSVLFGHGGAEHLQRAQFTWRHWKQTDQTQTIFIIWHSGKRGHITALNETLKSSD